jgi:uncharacterized protein YjgD (DUF1641 family)
MAESRENLASGSASSRRLAKNMSRALAKKMAGRNIDQTRGETTRDARVIAEALRLVLREEVQPMLSDMHQRMTQLEDLVLESLSTQ